MIITSVAESYKEGWVVKKLMTKNFRVPVFANFWQIKENIFKVGPNLLIHFFPMFPFDPPLKTSENQSFSDVFRGIKRENWEEMG